MIPSRVKDITGRRFGKLVVRALAGVSVKRKEAMMKGSISSEKFLGQVQKIYEAQES